jgi:tripeptide aminopeptidase
MAASVVERFKQIVPIANPSGKEATIREHILAELTRLGFTDNTVDEAGNLLARIPGAAEKEPILLSAHMDSVPPCEGIEPVEDTVEGRHVIRSAGKTILGADDKSGIATMLSIVERLSQAETTQNHPLELFFSTQEEVGLLGAKAFDITQCRSKAGFVLDGEGSLGEIFIAGPTQKNLVFNLKGIPSHAGIAPEEGVSAIMMASRLAAKLPSGRLSPITTMNLGTIEGGNAFNIVASTATIRGELRSHDEDALQGVLNQIEVACQNIKQDFPRGEVEFIPNHRYTRFEVPENHASVLMSQAACQKMGITPKLARMNIGSDAHVLNHAGLPTVVLGMGFHFSHSLGEFIYVDELEQVAELVWTLVQS